MKRSIALVMVTASLALVGCGGGTSSGGNADPEPIIKDTNPEVTVEVQAPDGFLPLREITINGGLTQMDVYLTYDPSFTDESLKDKSFIVDGSTELKDRVQKDRLMTVSAYNHDLNVILSDAIGIMPQVPTETYKANLNAVSTAISKGVVDHPNLTHANGIEDEIASLSLADTLDEAAVVALQLEGYSRTDAKGAIKTVKAGALEAELGNAGAHNDLQSLFQAHLNDSYWIASNGSALMFTAGMVAYDFSGTADAAAYEVALNNITFEMSVDLGEHGSHTIDLTNVIDGGDTLTLQGQTFTRQ